MLTLISLDAFRLVRPLAYQFKTSFAKREFISHVIVKAVWRTKEGKNITSLGEATTHSEPYYNGEYDLTALAYIKRVTPFLMGNSYIKPENLHELLHKKHVDKHNRFAIAALDIAFHDAFAKEKKVSLAKYLASHYAYSSSVLKEIPIGVSVGMGASKALFAQIIAGYVLNGVKKIKLKIEPGRDLEHINVALDSLHGNHVKIMVDANSSYSLEDPRQHADLIEIARQVDILEQPLGFDDLWHHAVLIADLIKKKITVKVCLDECIRSVTDIYTITQQVRALTHAPFTTIYKYLAVNIKISRMGGLFPSMAAAIFCKKKGITIMPGGMHEFSIGRAAIVAFTALDSDFEHGDSEGAETYYPAGEITLQKGKPTTTLNTNLDGFLSVPQGNGLGVGELATKDFIKVAPQTYVVDRDIREKYWAPAWNPHLYDEVLTSL